MGAPPPACTVQEVQSERGGGGMPPVPLLLFWDADGLATGSDVDRLGVGPECVAAGLLLDLFHTGCTGGLAVRRFHGHGFLDLTAAVLPVLDEVSDPICFHRLFPLYCASSGCTCDAPKNDAR